MAGDWEEKPEMMKCHLSFMHRVWKGWELLLNCVFFFFRMPFELIQTIKN